MILASGLEVYCINSSDILGEHSVDNGCVARFAKQVVNVRNCGRLLRSSRFKYRVKIRDAYDGAWVARTNVSMLSCDSRDISP